MCDVNSTQLSLNYQFGIKNIMQLRVSDPSSLSSPLPAPPSLSLFCLYLNLFLLNIILSHHLSFYTVTLCGCDPLADPDPPNPSPLAFYKQGMLHRLGEILCLDDPSERKSFFFSCSTTFLYGKK